MLRVCSGWLVMVEGPCPHLDGEHEFHGACYFEVQSFRLERRGAFFLAAGWYGG